MSEEQQKLIRQRNDAEAKLKQSQKECVGLKESISKLTNDHTEEVTQLKKERDHAVLQGNMKPANWWGQAKQCATKIPPKVVRDSILDRLRELP